jgi:glycosyltransferase involved in cell wall biosynthesis
MSIVIPTRDRRDRIGPLLDRLAAQSGDCETVVVDDRSTDGTGAYLRSRAQNQPGLVVVDGPGRGPLMARVTGVQVAGGDVVLLLDDDVMPAEGLVPGHRQHHAEGEDLLVLGYMPTRTETRRQAGDFTTRLYADEYEGRCERYRTDPGDVLRHLWMGNLSLRRERLLDVTLNWPGELPAFRHEDTEIGLRLASLGVRPVFDERLLAVHEHRRTLAQFRRDNRLDGAGLAELDAEGRDVFGPPGLGRFSEGLSGPLRRLLRLSRPSTGYRLTSGAVATALTAAGRLGAFGPETQLARLLRRIERQHGYLHQVKSGQRTSVPAA